MYERERRGNKNKLKKKKRKQRRSDTGVGDGLGWAGLLLVILCQHPRPYKWRCPAVSRPFPSSIDLLHTTTSHVHISTALLQSTLIRLNHPSIHHHHHPSSISSSISIHNGTKESRPCSQRPQEGYHLIPCLLQRLVLS